MRKKNILGIFVGTGLILSIPLVAMQLSSEWDWDLRDFLIIGVLLVGVGMTYESFASRMQADRRPILAFGLLALLILIWAELAVGIFGTPFAGS